MINAEIISTSSNAVMAACMLVGLFKFVFKVKFTFKIPKFKELPVHKCIFEINKKRKELDNLSNKVLNSLEKLKYDDADLYFIKSEDVKIFKELSGSLGHLEIKGDTPETRETNYFNFYNNLTKRGREELENLEIKIFNNTLN